MIRLLCAASLPFTFAAAVAAAAGPVPLSYVGTEKATAAADGGLRPAVGVHNIEVVRSNRTTSPHADGLLDSYLHQPMLAYWKGKFYLEYLSGPRDEHEDPCVTSVTTSADGVHWDRPRVVFPSFKLPTGAQTIAHQRMGLYVAPDGRLLILAFYGVPPSPNDGNGIGRAIREVKEDGTFGPIYFIKLNQKREFPQFQPPYPLYSTSPDKGFVAACEALLANKLVTAQWWEEDQLDESDFYRIKGKAMSYVHRPDGSVLGIWKNALVSTTTNGGQTWADKQFATNLPNNASKYWLQRTGDGLYALFLNPTNRQRLPLAVMTSTDSAAFSNLMVIHGEVPDQRFPGKFKNIGPQYVRGIVEGNGTPPDSESATWVTYSVNKEDIWVSRVPVPIRSHVEQPVQDDFEETAIGSLPADWNIYSPAWAPVRVVQLEQGGGHALELRDEEPYDYARATRVFPQTHGMKMSFRVMPRQTNARLEIELLDAGGARPLVLALGEDGHIWANHEGVWTDNGTYTANAWISFEVSAAANPSSDRFPVLINGQPANPKAVGPAEAASTVERLSFRTGFYRYRGEGVGHDLPRADSKAPLASFLVDDVSVVPQK